MRRRERGLFSSFFFGFRSRGSKRGRKTHFFFSLSNNFTGARPLKRAITALVDDPLSDALLSGALEEGDVARLDDVSGDPEGSWSKVPGAVVGAAGVVCTSVKPGQAKRRGSGGSGSGGSGTTLKSEVVYSTLSARRAAKEAAKAKEQEKEDVKA